jgi:hypothetical protein
MPGSASSRRPSVIARADLVRAGGGDRHEVPAAVAPEVRQDGRDPVQQAADVDVDHPVPLVDVQ